MATGEVFEPYRLLDVDGGVVGSVAAFLRDVQACGRSASTLRSYGLDLLRWFRFVWAIEVPWDRVTAVEARDFCCWIQLIDKPVGVHWRHRDAGATATPAASSRRPMLAPNPVTGKRASGLKYAATTVAHCETVLRGFYEFHLEAGSGPMVNPFPLVRHRRAGRANAHHNPMDAFAAKRSGRFRPKLVKRAPRRIPDEAFDELFAQLGSHRDRALVAFWISTGARASELLGATLADVDPGQQLITVIRKGNPGVAAVAGLAGCVRVAAAVSGATSWVGSDEPGSALVVDPAAAVARVELPRGAGDVHPGQRRNGSELVAA